MVKIKVDQHQKGNSKMALSQNVKFPIFTWCMIGAIFEYDLLSFCNS